MEGWIKLHRKILSSPIFNNTDLFKVWLYCLLKASHKPYELMVGDQLVKLNPGQFVFGRNKAAIELNMSDSSTWRRMKKLEKLGNLDIKSNNKYSVITIVNWHKYQDGIIESEQQNEQQMDNNRTTNEQQMDNNRTTNEQQMDTNNNVNNVNNVNKYNNAQKIQDDEAKNDFESLWKEYPNKKGKQKAFTSYKKAIHQGTTNEEILSGINRYKEEIRIKKTDSQYIKYGSTFFTNKAWEDDYITIDKDNEHQEFSLISDS